MIGQCAQAGYNAEAKLLNLAACVGSLTPALGRGASFLNKAFVNALLGIVQQHFQNVETLSLAGNAIASLQPLRMLSTALPALKNLDLSGNDLSSLGELAALSGYRSQLRELLIANNPATTAGDMHLGLYHHEVRSFFPSLKMLDQVAVMASVISFPVCPCCSTNCWTLQRKV